MKGKRLAQVFALCAFAATTAMCSNNDLEDETQDVIEEQQEAAKVAEENPQDTAKIREEANEALQEQREAAAALKKEVKAKGLDTAHAATHN